MAAVSLGASNNGGHLQTRYAPASELPTTPLQQSAIAIIFFVTFFAFTICALRMYTRFSSKQLGCDDWLACAAMAFSLALVGPNYLFFKYDYIGFTREDFPKDYDPEPALFWNWIMQVLYNPILALVKSSVLMLLLRLGGHRDSIRWSIYILNTFNIALMIAIFFTVIFQTTPINAFWDLSIERTKQITPVFYISTAIITIVTDVLVLLIPFWVFLGLKMRVAAKIGLLVVFLLGGFVTIVGIIRVIELHRKIYDKDYYYRDSLGDTLSCVEVNLAIIAACCPVLRPLFRKMFPGLFTTHGSHEDIDYNKSDTNTGSGRRQTPRTSTFPLKDLHMNGRTRTEIRSHSPNDSEEEIMTYNGIIRTTAVNINYDQATLDEGRISVHGSMDPIRPK